ncbi:MAG: RrF2 family transcriptional regulator [Candidatus Bipolaricaulota bacterium]
MVFFSTSVSYAIKALTFLAGASENGYYTVNSVAEEVDVPAQFLGKIFQGLAKEGILRSQKGRGGGFQFARSAEKVALFDVVEAVEGVDSLYQCPFDLTVCSEDEPCPLHEEWKPIRDEVVNLLRRKTIADLAVS